MNIAILHIHTLRHIMKLARRHDARELEADETTRWIVHLWSVYQQDRERGKYLTRERYLERKIAKKYA
jgi:hypothetical protein